MLHYDLLNDILNLSGIGNKLIMEVKLNKRHDYKIYQGKDGWWYTYIKDETKKTGRRQLKRSTKGAIIDYLEEVYALESPTIEEVFNEWNERRLNLGLIKNSTFTRNEQIFKKHFGKIARWEISKIVSNDVSDFLEEQLSDGISIRAFGNLKAVLRGFLKRARKRGLIFFNIEEALSDVDISDRSFKVSVKDDKDEIFFDDEMEQILDYCFRNRDDVNCLGVALMFVAGLRVGEVVALKKSDILDGKVRVERTETRYRKDGHMVFEVTDNPKTPAGIRTVIVPDRYLWILDELKKHGNDFIFIGKNGNRLHTQAVRKRVYQICKKLNMPVRSPHKIRKTYGSILLDNGLDDKLIQRQMGHTDISCTRNYYYKDKKYDEEKRAAINSVRQFE